MPHPRTPTMVWKMIPFSRHTISVAALGALGAVGPHPLSDPVHAFIQDPSPPPTCDDLATFAWSGFTLDDVSTVEATEYDPVHCRVRGTIDTEIRFELLLPQPADWNGRFIMGGGGGYVGSVQNQALGFFGSNRVLTRGFATVGTDTGHRGVGTDASWALNRPDREVNFGHRAVHVTAQTAKTIIRIYYGRDIDYSYFMGCSRGGGQGMMASQRYPDDFDGIVAGAPAYHWTGLGALFLQTQQALYPDPNDLSTPVIDAEAAMALETAILEACDENDGVKDGFMTNPLACDIDLASIPGLTDEQRRAAEMIYGGARVGGQLVHPGYPYGGEATGEWPMWITGGGGSGTPNLHYAFGTQMHKYIIFDNPDFDYSTYDFSDYAAWEADTRRTAKLLNATDTDLSAFKTAGGRLILWTGWSDAAIPAKGTVSYYEGVAAGDEEVDDYLRMFMLPGVQHCGGGPGPAEVDWITTIQKWVEEGEAPEWLIATKTNRGEVEMQRPICAWPAEAVYKGSGDPMREENFECREPEA
ncbi:MAG: tannase/feruloyl esterase family alpha/beta hydrolase [Gemmatimonadetes bacterium]|nr:tannase/feruloyl esterase family alpha/beta hydrolase [Gemmatimonadota bacterium]MYB98017.1 tannase/feruloyl esterase family alpha/beta hydrolase [Gemmatimonadota bacterium]